LIRAPQGALSAADDDDGAAPAAAAVAPLEFQLDDGPAIEELLKAYPIGIIVNDLPHPSEETDDKVEVARALYKEGFLVIEDEASKDIQSSSIDGDDGDPF